MSQKVKIFIWKLARNGLGVQSNRMRQHLIPYATCSICGMEPENGHHAMVHCTFASSLRHALRGSWTLPDDLAFMYTGPDERIMYLALKQISLSYLALKSLNFFLSSIKLKFPSLHSTAVYLG